MRKTKHLWIVLLIADFVYVHASNSVWIIMNMVKCMICVRWMTEFEFEFDLWPKTLLDVWYHSFKVRWSKPQTIYITTKPSIEPLSTWQIMLIRVSADRPILAIESFDYAKNRDVPIINNRNVANVCYTCSATNIALNRSHMGVI